MDRRSFLRATLVSAGSVALGIGCGDDEANPADATDAGTDTGVDLGSDVDAGPSLLPGEQFFPQSIASGDPRDSSVVLWTRVEDSAQDGDITLSLQLALDEAFTSRVTLDGSDAVDVVAEASFGHCAKVKLTDLDAATTYYYRFVHTVDGDLYVSRIGRTRTAPAPDADVEVNFAFLSCQDYSGNYYNALKRLAHEDVDFVVHLGDYVYETSADPLFQDSTPERSMVFSDESGAIPFNEGTDEEFFAASSLSNYRDLYRTYRADRDLQRIHERYPMIAVWDDHEFSDDCFGATATYFDGAADEHDIARRKRANQAWFEYMPVDYGDDDFRYDPEADYPEDITIYRDFRFGRHLHLVMTDLRSYRVDHIVPEDAFPGSIILTESDLETMVGEVPDEAGHYVDVGDYADGLYQTALQGAATAVGYAVEQVTGDVLVAYINQVVEGINAGGGEAIPLIEGDALTDLPRGFAFAHLGKRTPSTIIGTRYLGVDAVFRLYAAKRWAESDGESEQVLGETQENWFLDTIQNSTGTWKVWGNEYALSQRLVDLSSFVTLPEEFRTVFRLSLEDWDGLPNRRQALIETLADVGNVVSIAGDIHAFFASTPWLDSDHAKKIVEFVGGAVSSSTYEVLLARNAAADPTLRAAGAAGLALLAGGMLQEGPNPGLAYADLSSHGFVRVTVSESTLEATMFAIPRNLVTAPLEDDAVLGAFGEIRFKVDSGSPELWKDIDGTWHRWDPETLAWVTG